MYHILESMSEVAAIVDDIGSLQTAEVSLDLKARAVSLSFTLNGQSGYVELSIRPQANDELTGKKFRSRLYAAAISVLGGRKPRSWETALNTVRGTVRSAALKILTNPSEWRVTGLRYGEIRF